MNWDKNWNSNNLSFTISFTEVSKIRNRIREILISNKDEEKISSPNQEFLTDLIKYHYNWEDKIKDLEYFTTGYHSAHSYSRCFYIVKNDEKHTKAVKNSSY